MFFKDKVTKNNQADRVIINRDGSIRMNLNNESVREDIKKQLESAEKFIASPSCKKFYCK